jgi:hypothetical protein
METGRRTRPLGLDHGSVGTSSITDRRCHRSVDRVILHHVDSKSSLDRNRAPVLAISRRSRRWLRNSQPLRVVDGASNEGSAVLQFDKNMSCGTSEVKGLQPQMEEPGRGRRLRGTLSDLDLQRRRHNHCAPHLRVSRAGPIGPATTREYGPRARRFGPGLVGQARSYTSGGVRERLPDNAREAKA